MPHRHMRQAKKAILLSAILGTSSAETTCKSLLEMYNANECCDRDATLGSCHSVTEWANHGLQEVYNHPDTSATKYYRKILGEKITKQTVLIRDPETGKITETFANNPFTNMDPDGWFIRYDENGALIKEKTSNVSLEDRVLTNLYNYTAKIHGKDLDYINHELVGKSAIDALTYYASRGMALPGPDNTPNLNQRLFFSNYDTSSSFHLGLDLNHVATQNKINVYQSGFRNYFEYDSPGSGIEITPISVDVTNSRHEYDHNVALKKTTIFHDTTCGEFYVSLFDEEFPVKFGGYPSTQKVESLYLRLQMVKRDAYNTLVPADLNSVIALMPLDDIKQKASYTWVTGAQLSRNYDYPKQAGGKYFGLPLLPLNGGDSALDIQMTLKGAVNGFASFRENSFLGSGKKIGDNVFTHQEEDFGVASLFELYDTDAWGKFLITLSDFEDLSIPEAPFDPSKTFVTKQPVSKGVFALTSHELLHTIQFGRGQHPFARNGEGPAVSFEFDSNVFGKGVFSSFNRMPSFITYLEDIWSGRIVLGSNLRGYADSSGNHVLTSPDHKTTSDQTFGFSQYGEGLFYVWFKEKYDKNIQIHKVVHHNMVELLKTRTYEQQDLWRGGFAGYLNPNYFTKSIRDAVEVFAPDDSEVLETYENFLISCALLRNNPEVPEQYRMNFPFHYLREDVPVEFKKLLLGTETWPIFSDGYYTWYDSFLSNKPVPYKHHYSGIKRNNRIMPSWPRTVYTVPPVPENTCQAGQTQLYMFYQDLGTWNSENSFKIYGDDVELYNSGAMSNADFTDRLCLDTMPTKLSYELIDSYGDGWQGNVLTVWFGSKTISCDPVTLQSGASSKTDILVADLLTAMDCSSTYPDSLTFEDTDQLAPSVTRKMLDMSSFTFRMPAEKPEVHIHVEGNAHVSCTAVTFKSSVPRAFHKVGPVMTSNAANSTMNLGPLHSHGFPVNLVCLNKGVTENPGQTFKAEQISTVTLF